jgi:putative toxin-antitoxin system antitoxin component (TIGR02293 family)
VPFGTKINAKVSLTGGRSMLHTEALVKALGGKKVFKRRIVNVDQLRETVKAGLPYASLEALIDKFGLAREEAAAALHLPQRTIARRKKEQKLQADESDRLLRLARVGAQAAATLGSDEKAVQWLRRPNRALGNRAPLDLIDSDIGTRQVEEVLGRIEHGNLS